MAKNKRQRNERKKKSHEQRYGMTAKEWSNFKKTATKEEVLAIRVRALKMLQKNNGQKK
jgi:hypothetical protein